MNDKGVGKIVLSNAFFIVLAFIESMIIQLSNFIFCAKSFQALQQSNLSLLCFSLFISL